MKPKEHKKTINEKRTKVTYKTTHKALQRYTKKKKNKEWKTTQKKRKEEKQIKERKRSWSDGSMLKDDVKSNINWCNKIMMHC